MATGNPRPGSTMKLIGRALAKAVGALLPNTAQTNREWIAESELCWLGRLSDGVGHRSWPPVDGHSPFWYRTDLAVYELRYGYGWGAAAAEMELAAPRMFEFPTFSYGNARRAA
jgi:hypothetical protein